MITTRATIASAAVKRCATMCYMRRSRVAVRELRQNLSVHLRKVKAGQVLEVTERGIPVAQITPLPRPDDPLARLEAAGIVIRRATKRIEDLPRPTRLPRGVSISKVLDELRKDRL
jgi:prevent-host-death family protein